MRVFKRLGIGMGIGTLLFAALSTPAMSTYGLNSVKPNIEIETAYPEAYSFMRAWESRAVQAAGKT